MGFRPAPVVEKVPPVARDDREEEQPKLVDETLGQQ
jgi:hypothetical protein